MGDLFGDEKLFYIENHSFLPFFSISNLKIYAILCLLKEKHTNYKTNSVHRQFPAAKGLRSEDDVVHISGDTGGNICTVSEFESQIKTPHPQMVFISSVSNLITHMHGVVNS